MIISLWTPGGAQVGIFLAESVIFWCFKGVTGNVIFDDNGDRSPDFLIWHYKEEEDMFRSWTNIQMDLREGQVCVNLPEIY